MKQPTSNSTPAQLGLPLLISLLVLMPFATAGPAQDMAELELDHNVQSEFVTPHTPWATPYVLGKTRVLFFLDGRGTNPREVVELQQRFDLEPQMVFWTCIIDTTQEQWHGAERGIQRMARLLTRKWDAFVFLDVPLENVPVEQQYAIIKAVTEGAGLVLFGTDDKRVLKDKNQLKQVPAFLEDVGGATAFTVRQGRGVRLPKRPAIEYRPGWEVEYDEWDMRLGKAILWAASKEPKLNLTLTTKSKELPRSDLPAAAAKLAWQGAAPPVAADITLRRDDGAILLTTRRALDKPEGDLDLDMPLVRAGKYHLNVVARGGDRVAGFASTPLAVVCPQQEVQLQLDQDWAEVGQTLSGKVRLIGERRPDHRVIVSLLDRRDREISRQTAKSDTAHHSFQFAVQPWFPMLLEVRATLVAGTDEVASAWQFARVVDRRRGRFNFVMWDTPRGNLAPWAEQALAGTGVTVHLRAGSPEPSVAACDIAWIPYTTHIGAACQPACWSDAAKIQSHVDGIVDQYVPAGRHGVFVYSLGDEIVVRGSCLSPQCLEAYRKYLEGEYGQIAALNASWGANYAGFHEVQLGKPDDNDEAEALRSGNFPRWFDRQAFQSHNFCKLCERFGSGFRRIDPQSRCGFEGAGRFDAADDLDGFVRSNAFWSPYPGTADEVLRSIAPRDFPRSNWMGYTKDADTLLEKYWRMVTRGCDAVWWWRWDALGRFHGWLAPTLDPYPAVKEILADTQIVRDGLGDLLLTSDMQTDGIGILYSLASAYAAKVQASPTFGSYESNHTAFHHALRDLGLNFRYFTDRQMRLGEVDLSQFKVILLPMTQAVSPREAEMLRAYVRDGGTLIADVRPAIYDGHVKPLAAGQLDDVFGVKRTGFAAAVVGGGSVKVPSADDKPPPLELPNVRADAGIQPAEASASGSAGQVPLALRHGYGKGRAMLLNLAMSSFPALGAANTPEAAAQFVQQMLSQGGVSLPLLLAGADGQRLRNVEITRWNNGPVQIVSLLRHHGRPEAAKLELPESLHVYDLKARKDLGLQRSVDLTITPFRAIFYALSPQPLGPVALNVAPSVSRGNVGRVAITSALPAGRQAVRLEVKLPDGRLADWIDPVVVTDKKGIVVDVPVACNDPRGTWTIQATELYTSAAATAQFTVE
ncbi:MAG: beta-galactosidase trimerization domain-containing protein [Pirellulales bacterium]|nr:beta-galactosidase trimerization domain-containing protein [Pirellulales bacterium]